MKKIAVVGGGLAGLAAAYTLVKQGDRDVVLFESLPYLGGRTQSRKVRGQNVDFGGFLIYPWYKQGHKLFTDLGLSEQLIKTPLKEIYYFLDQITPIKEDEIPFSKWDTLNVWSKSILKLFSETNVSQPNLDSFEQKTISEYLRSSLNTKEHAGLYETFFDTVNQGYCYGPADKTKIAFMAPFIRQTTLYGDIHRTSLFPEGMKMLSDKLASEITRMGGKIHLETPVVGIRGLTIQTDTEEFPQDEIIFAQTVSKDLYGQILSEVSPDVWYTHFITAAVELSDTPIIRDTKDWGAAFYASDEQMPRQALSVINLSSLHGPSLESCVMLNIILRDRQTETIDSIEINQIVKSEIERLFPTVTLSSTIDSIHWKKTMPVAQEPFVQTIRNLQGQNGYYFAGDFLGAPSIETAIATGIQAAQSIIDLK